MKEQIVINVSADGAGDCRTVGEALSFAGRYAGQRVSIRIGKGNYYEKLTISQPGLTLEGAGPEDTVIYYDDYARKRMPDGTEYGTFRTASVMVDADDFTARDICFRNTAGSGSGIGQALALYVDGDRILFENCRITGGQDTLFTAPLPPSAMIPGGFRGPKENAPRTVGRHWYKDCFIAGNVDFIFGGATAYFENCEIFSNGKGYVTAASTPEGEKYGYVFNGCSFTGDCGAESVYLGRPWRDYARVVILNSRMSGHVNKKGWHDWDKAHARESAFFAEYHNTGEGADTKERVIWSKQLDDEEAKAYSRQAVLGDWAAEAAAP